MCNLYWCDSKIIRSGVFLWTFKLTIWFYKMRGNSWPIDKLVASQEIHCSVYLVPSLCSRTTPVTGKISHWKAASVGNLGLVFTMHLSIPYVTEVCRNVLHRVIQRERSIFWEVIISVIMRKNVRMNMIAIPDSYRDRAV